MSLSRQSRLPKKGIEWNDRTRSEKGFVLVWAALMITMLLGFAGLSVDLGNWYLHIQRAQRAADAASLDGDAYMPDSFTQATAVAKDSLLRNGIPATDVNRSVITQVPGDQNKLSVTVPTTINDVFLTFFNNANRTVRFSRTSIANHLSDLHMASGSNALGAPQPGGSWSAADSANATYTLGIDGKMDAKVMGDRYSTSTCNDPAFAGEFSTYGCSGNSNTDYRNTGYDYRIHIQASTTPGPKYLIIEGFDPGYAATGTDCPGMNLPAGYCMGDEQPGTPNASLPAMTTSFTLLDAKKDRVVATCNSYIGTQDGPGENGKPGFGWMHNWVMVCPGYGVNPGVTQDYILRVTSDGGEGSNAFMLRAGFSSDNTANRMDLPDSQRYITLSADTDMAINNTVSTTDTKFRLAQVPSDYAGKTVSFEFFDIGDATQAGTLSVISDVSGAITNNCTYTPPGSTSFVPANAGGRYCTIAFQGGLEGNAAYQGQLVTVRWTVPSTYRCQPTSVTKDGGCWVYVDISYPDSASVDDFSTWSIHEPGDPLRIIK